VPLDSSPREPLSYLLFGIVVDYWGNWRRIEVDCRYDAVRGELRAWEEGQMQD